MEYIANLPLDFWITLATVIITILLGFATKKYTKLDNKKIPIQNMFIGIFVFVIEYIITRNVNTAVAISGILSGGTYDIGKAFIQLFKEVN